MFSIACCLKSNARILPKANRNFLTHRSVFSPYQIVRSQHIFVYRPIAASSSPRIVLRDAYSLRSAPRGSNTRRFVTTSDAAPSGSRKLKRFFRILLRVGVGACAIAVLGIGYAVRTLLYPTEFSTWPESIRVLVAATRGAQIVGRKEQVLTDLTKIWEILQVIPINDLRPDPAVKMLGIAIWFSDALERDNQSVKAYRLLEQAIDMYQTRFKASAVSNDTRQGERAVTQADSEIAEKRHLISVFLRLSDLSRSVQPRSEGKWLTRAIRESFGLLSSSSDVDMPNYMQFISDLEPLSYHDAAFAGLSDDLTAQTKHEKDLPKVAEGNKAAPPSNIIAADELTNTEDALPLPRWHVRDVISAIAVPLEKVGLYADRHGQRDVAVRSYRLARDILASIFKLVDFRPEDASVAYWANLTHLLRIINRHDDLHLRDLDEQTHAAEWLYRLHVAFKDSWLAQDVTTRVMQIHNAKGSRWKVDLSRKYGLPFEFMFENGVQTRFKAIYFWKMGDLDAAEDFLQKALFISRLTKPSGQKNSAGSPAKTTQGDLFFPAEQTEEMRKCEQALNAVRRSKAEGKFSIKSHMNPIAVKEWEEAVNQSSKKKDDKTAPSQN